MHTPLIWPDVLILAIIIFSLLVGFWRGFVKEALSLGIWLVAFFLSYNFYKDLAKIIEPFFKHSTFNLIISFVTIFIVVLIFGTLINWVLSKFLAISGVGLINRLLGMFFGAARGVIFVLVVYLISSYTPLAKEDFWQNSILITKFQSLASWTKVMLPDKIPDIQHLIGADALIYNTLEVIVQLRGCLPQTFTAEVIREKFSEEAQCISDT